MRLSIPKLPAHGIRSSYPCHPFEFHSPWRKWSNWFQLGLWGDLRIFFAKLTVPCKEMSKLRSDIWKIWEFSLGLLSRARIRSVWHSLCFCFLTSWVHKHRKAVLRLHRQFMFLFFYSFFTYLSVCLISPSVPGLST